MLIVVKSQSQETKNHNNPDIRQRKQNMFCRTQIQIAIAAAKNAVIEPSVDNVVPITDLTTQMAVEEGKVYSFTLDGNAWIYIGTHQKGTPVPANRVGYIDDVYDNI